MSLDEVLRDGNILIVTRNSNSKDVASNNYNESIAEQNGSFLGLDIDDDQFGLIDDKIAKWVETIKSSF